MRDRFRFARCAVPMNLQLFAEGGDGGGGNDPGGGTGGSGGDGGGAGGGGKPQSFDDFLKTGSNQAEFDRRLQKAIDTAVSNAREKWQILADDRVSEAEKLAKMTAQEKAEYLAGKHEKELSEREAAITKRELTAEAKNTLADKKIPQELAAILDYTSADTVKTSIETVEKAFNAAVEAAVSERLKGSDPMKKASEDSTDDLSKKVAAAVAGGMW